MNVAAALLSLNPLALFDHSRTGNLDDLIKKTRIKLSRSINYRKKNVINFF